MLNANCQECSLLETKRLIRYQNELPPIDRIRSINSPAGFIGLLTYQVVRLVAFLRLVCDSFCKRDLASSLRLVSRRNLGFDRAQEKVAVWIPTRTFSRQT